VFCVAIPVTSFSERNQNRNLAQEQEEELPLRQGGIDVFPGTMDSIGLPAPFLLIFRHC
jgi:hypothetical protein